MALHAAGSAAPRQLAPGLVIHLPMQAHFTEIPDVEYDVILTLQMTDSGVRPTAVEVVGRDGSEITGTTLRSVRVADLARQALRHALQRADVSIEDNIVQITQREDLSVDDVTRLRTQGPVDETLRWVAYYYRVGEAIGTSPARQVELELELPRTTASKWIRRARARGFLSPVAAVDEGVNGA